MGSLDNELKQRFEHDHYVDSVDKSVYNLPSYKELHSEVSKLVKNSSWFEVYGKDNLIIWSFMACVPFGFKLLASKTWPPFILGMVLMGLIHGMIVTKASHLVAHSSLSRNVLWNKFIRVFFVELCGAFTVNKGLEIHISIHHPHTNVIGLGDSSSWKAPFLNRVTYMFLAPLAIPVITPLVAIASLWGHWKHLATCVPMIIIGLTANIYILTSYCGLSFTSAVVTMLLSRTLLSIPYIHVNIFQHIGLNMYSRENRPQRLELMSNGCLNLPNNPLLDYCFGHSLISCHVEHHLFPHLSDNMCLKIKPIVKRYLLEKQLPYHEDSYWSRLLLFMKKYKELMVDPPPITSLVGIQ